MPSRARRSTGQSPRCARRSATWSASGALERPGEAAVGQEQDAVGVGGGDRVVGDHDDGLAEVVDDVAQEGEDLAAGPRVERAGRLVGEDDLGPRDERAGDRDALLLAARELGGPVAQAVAEPDAVDDLVAPGPVERARADSRAAARCSARRSAPGAG